MLSSQRPFTFTLLYLTLPSLSSYFHSTLFLLFLFQARTTMRPLHLLYAAMTLLGVAADDPKVGVTRFKNLPSKLFYFEDTTVGHSLHTATNR